jgi:hypothetical protein
MSVTSMTDVWVARAQERVNRGNETEDDIMYLRKPGEDVSAQIRELRERRSRPEECKKDPTATGRFMGTRPSIPRGGYGNMTGRRE